MAGVLRLDCTEMQIGRLQTRVAELESRLARWRSAIEPLTPGGSEYVDEPENCAATIKIRIDKTIQFAKERKEAQARLAELEAKLAAAEREAAKWKLAFKARCEQADERDSEISDQFTLLADAEREARNRAETAEARAKKAEEAAEAAEREWEIARLDNQNAKIAMAAASEAIRAVEGVNANLRAALEMMEWPDNGTNWPSCPWCLNPQTHGHKPDCARQAALEPQQEGEET